MSTVRSVLDRYPGHYQSVPRFSDHLAKKKRFLRAASQIRGFAFRGKQPYRTVIISGTNGKGSVANIAASLLMMAGFSVGTISSPAMTDNCTDMIKVNGVAIDVDVLLARLTEAERIIASSQVDRSLITHYMLLCIAAYRHFDLLKVDFVIAETAIGGLYDPTVPLRPDVCVFTNVRSDHLDVLGSSIEQRCQHKSRIIGQNSVVLFGEELGRLERQIIARYARRKNGLIVELDVDPIRNSSPRSRSIYSSSTLELHDDGGWTPSYQHPNLRLAAAIVEQLIHPISKKLSVDINACRSSLFPPFRFDIRERNAVRYLFDCAKNEDSYIKLRDSLYEFFEPQDLSYLKGAEDQASVDLFERIMRPERVIYISGYHPRVMHRPGFIDIHDLDFDSLEHTFATRIIVVCGMFLSPKIAEKIFPYV